MFGIAFVGHPYLRHLYLPGDFEGHPLRKDFPLLARLVKPWPGIVDVEPCPARTRPTRPTARPRRRRGRPLTAERQQARLHRRPGRRRPGQRRARDRGHDPQHRPAAPGHPRHAAHRRQARRRAGRRGRADDAATCTGATRSSPRSAPTRRSPRWSTASTGWAASPTRCRSSSPPRSSWRSRRRRGPSGSARSLFELSPHRQHRRCSSATWACSSARSRRSSTPSATASSCSTRSRRSPAAASTPTSTASAASRTTCPRAGSPRPRRSWSKIRGFCDEIEDLLIGNEIFAGPHPGHRRHPRRRRRCPTACRAPTCGRRASTGTSAATLTAAAWPTTSSTGRSGPTPTATRFARYWVRLQETREATKIVDQLSTACPPGRSWPRSPASSRCPRARPASPPRTRSARWATTSCRKGDLGPFRVKIRSAVFNNISIVPWVLRGVYVPDVITILASLYFILGDIDR